MDFMTAVFPPIVLVVGMVLLSESPRRLARKGFRDRVLKGLYRIGKLTGWAAKSGLPSCTLAAQAGTVGWFASPRPPFGPQ